MIARLGLPAKVQDLLAVCGLIPLAGAAYGGLLLALKIEGREELGELWAKIRAKLPGG